MCLYIVVGVETNESPWEVQFVRFTSHDNTRPGRTCTTHHHTDTLIWSRGHALYWIFPPCQPCTLAFWAVCAEMVGWGQWLVAQRWKQEVDECSDHYQRQSRGQSSSQLGTLTLLTSWWNLQRIHSPHSLLHAALLLSWNTYYINLNTSPLASEGWGSPGSSVCWLVLVAGGWWWEGDCLFNRKLSDAWK